VKDEMSEPNTPKTVSPDHEIVQAEVVRTPGARIIIDPASPSARSIMRVVVITLLLLLVAGVVQVIVSSLTSLIFLICLSVFFAYLIDPLVRVIKTPFDERNLEWLMPRSLAIVVAYVFVFALIGLAIAYIAPKLTEQAKEFGTNLPTYAQSLRQRSLELNQRFDRLRVPDAVQDEVNRKITDLGTGITETVGNFVLGSITYLPWLVLVPILAFFFLKEANAFRLSVLRIFPPGRWRYRAELVMADVNTTLAAYTRASLISCLIIAFICTVGFYFIGLKYALLLGILAGILEFVPLLGPVTVAIIVILTAAAGDHPRNAIWAAIFLACLRIVHDYVTYPRIVRGGIHLHPLAIILAVLAGEQVAGIPGVFLAIPIVAVGTVFYRHMLEHQGRKGLLSGWFEGVEARKQEKAV
jgi:predicted PurR-regulated permease PerM